MRYDYAGRRRHDRVPLIVASRPSHDFSYALHDHYIKEWLVSHYKAPRSRLAIAMFVFIDFLRLTGFNYYAEIESIAPRPVLFIVGVALFRTAPIAARNK